MVEDVSGEMDCFTSLYYSNLGKVWDSLLPSPDVRIIKKDGTIEKVDQKIQQIVWHYLSSVAQLFASLVVLPLTFVLSTVSSLWGRVTVEKPSHQVDTPHVPKAFGFANSGFQDGAIGTPLDPSSLNGQGTADWAKILERAVQRVMEDGEKIGPITKGITLKEGDRIEDLFVNIIDYPEVFADLLQGLGCTAYRISLERSVIEPKEGEFNDIAIQKYQKFFQALQDKGIEPWVTLHHFTNPQWFEDLGGFSKEENIEGFVHYAEKMVESFPEITNWMTFNEVGIRALEGYVREEHPPEKGSVSEAALVIRNLLMAHMKSFQAMKAKKEDLNIGITHQWLKFLPFGWNPIEKITAFFFTNLIHTPILNFYKEGNLHIKIPFKANVQLKFEDETSQKVADFLGVQAYGFPRLKVGLNGGVAYPGAKDKVKNFILSSCLGLGFTAGSTCDKGGSMQYFGPPSKPSDLISVLEEAFSIPKERIPKIGITETGSDAKRMHFGKEHIELDETAQAKDFEEILAITEKYPLACLFLWTLNRHVEWRSGGMPHLGVTKLKNEEDGSISYKETPALAVIQGFFKAIRGDLQKVAVVA